MPKKEAKDHGKHCQEQIGHRRSEVAAQFVAKNDPDVPHCFFPLPAVVSDCGEACDSSPTSCRNTSSRLTAEDRSSLRSHPASITARARSPRAKPPGFVSTSQTACISRFCFTRTQLTPETRASRCCTTVESNAPLRPVNSTSTKPAPRARFCKL